MSNVPVKRRHVFINKAFQGRFIIGVFLLILLSGICSALLIYGLIGDDLLAQSRTAHANINDALARLGWSILIGNAVAITVSSTVAVVVAIYASHRIAGPLYRFEKLCEQVGNGQLGVFTSLREHDQLQQLGAAFTLMIEKLRGRQKQQQASIELIEQQLDTFKNHANLIGKQQEMLDAVTDTLQQLKAHVSHQA